MFDFRDTVLLHHQLPLVVVELSLPSTVRLWPERYIGRVLKVVMGKKQFEDRPERCSHQSPTPGSERIPQFALPGPWV